MACRGNGDVTRQKKPYRHLQDNRTLLQYNPTKCFKHRINRSGFAISCREFLGTGFPPMTSIYSQYTNRIQ